MSRRTDRVSDLLREELSDLIRREVKDPGVEHGLVSITEVVVSPDLRHATVYVSHLGEAGERDEVLRALGRAAHFPHRELGHRLTMKRVPELIFRPDVSIERGARLTALIHEVGHPAGGDAEGA
jgi:ribosome-binding factor A